MAQTTQAKYDAAVKKYWQARIDAAMKKKNITIKSDLKSVNIKQELPQLKTTEILTDPVTRQKVEVEQWTKEAAATKKALAEKWSKAQAALDQQTSDRRRAKARARRLKRQYESSARKAGWSENLLRVAEKKYWVNS